MASSTPKTRPTTAIDPRAQDEKPIVVSAEMIAVGSLIGRMKATVRALGETFDIIEKQQEKVAQLVPALKASKEIAALHERLTSQIATHTEEIKQLQATLQRRAQDEIRRSLREKAFSHIDQAVKERVPEKVTRLLVEKIPADLRAQGQTHKRQILEVQTSLYNSEARRLNSCMRSATDTFRPLWRPLHSTLDLPSPDSASSSGSLTASSATTLPTPSDNFPTDFKTLRSLSVQELKAILEENRVKIPMSDQEGDTRQTLMNLFMAYTGVPFRVFPETQPTAQPLVVRL